MIPRQLYINGKDAWETWGVFLEENSERAFLLPANNKEFVSNKNRSEHGKRVLVNNPRLDERDVQLVFCIFANSEDDFLEKYESFVAELNSGWVQMKVIKVKKVYNFTTTSFLDLGYYDDKGKLSVKFNEPNPDDRSIIRFYMALGTQDSKIVQTQDNKVVIK
ncbi:hypothetical protein CLV62_1182 [Dysgonomonas alginatilytica]|uniref:Uncharacterized protein n=1 Tax=Dysgonomonas alginatilytica TaxID=1605892 RepID=A0A2V3PLA7_9BACT|nr:hypothetical protein [Dysgonomonas alginatilytica]PXV62615.1 hypothetical protein CLV62_1182 [Dysgonomonas alginatilytica]